MIDRPKKRDRLIWSFKPTPSVKETIAQGLWTYTTPSLDSKGKKLIGSSSRSVRAHFSHPQYQYQSVYVQQPYIAQTSIQPRPSHPRVAAHPPPRPYA
ncbi:hypothetical protein AAG906_018470 [Vitis piasezkii]